MTGDSGNGPHEILKNTLAQLNLKDRRTVLADAVKALPDQLQKDVAAETAQILPDEVKRDVVNKAVQGMPTVDRKDIATRAFQDLSAKDRQDVAGNPSQYVTDQIWLTIVRTFSAVLFFSAIGLLYVSIWPPKVNQIPPKSCCRCSLALRVSLLVSLVAGQALVDDSWKYWRPRRSYRKTLPVRTP